MMYTLPCKQYCITNSPWIAWYGSDKLLVMMVMMSSTCQKWHLGIAPPPGNRKGSFFNPSRLYCSYTVHRIHVIFAIVNGYDDIHMPTHNFGIAPPSGNRQDCSLMVLVMMVMMRSTCLEWLCGITPQSAKKKLAFFTHLLSVKTTSISCCAALILCYCRRCDMPRMTLW